MPAPIAFTVKQLGDIAARVNGFTEHRRACAKMGVPTTPNSFRCRFPSGHRGTIVWEEARLSKKLLERNGNQPVWRYVVYLDATIETDEHPEPEDAMVITLPHGKDRAALEGAVNTAVLHALAKDTSRRGGPGIVIEAKGLEISDATMDDLAGRAHGERK